MTKNRMVHLVWPPLLIYISFILIKLVGYDSLTTLANDSVHYLVMARHYSPWVAESSAIAAAWLLQDFPPFFPWLLAITGTAHSLLYAHMLVTGLGLLSLYFYYLLACHWLNDRLLAIFPLLILALSSGFLLGLQGILSESLYLLLTLVFFLVYTRKKTRDTKKSTIEMLLIVLLLTAIFLTRTTGIALGLAIVIQAIFSSIAQKKLNSRPLLIALLSIAFYLVLMAWLGPAKQSHYSGLLIQFISGTDLYERGSSAAVHFSLITQLKYQLNAWSTFWLLYWNNNSFSASYLIISLLSLASMGGLLLRLLKNKCDAWYVLIFIAVLLVWPHPGQLFRLVFPIMPFLLIYAAYAILKLLQAIPARTNKADKKNVKKNTLIVSAFYLAVLAAILPSHAFIHARLALASSKQMVPVYESFRHANPHVAVQILETQNQMMKDFIHLPETISVDEKLLYFKPSYLAVLSERTAISAPSPITRYNYLSLIIKSGIRYIYLTRLHPRNSRLSYSGFQGIENLEGWTEIVWCSQMREGDYASCLIKVVGSPEM